MTDDEWQPFEKKLEESQVDIKLFMNSVEQFFAEHPTLCVEGEPVLHSTKKRLKDPDHLRKKVDRKNKEGRGLTPDNFLADITDLAGVRLLHLFQQDYSIVDAAIRKKVASGDWYLGEKPKAFTWIPK